MTTDVPAPTSALVRLGRDDSSRVQHKNHKFLYISRRICVENRDFYTCEALWPTVGVGFEQLPASGLLTVNHIIEIQSELERNNAGFRKLTVTAPKDSAV